MPPKNKPPPNPPPANPLSLPAWVVDPEARAEYKRLIQILGKNITPVDRSLLVDYCVLHGQILELQNAVDIEGHKLSGPKGGEYLNPTATFLMQKQSLLAALRRDLFFTPRSRGEKAKPKGKALSIAESLDVAVSDDETS